MLNGQIVRKIFKFPYNEPLMNYNHYNCNYKGKRENSKGKVQLDNIKNQKKYQNSK